MAVTKKNGASARMDFTAALHDAVGEGVVKTPTPNKVKQEEPALTIEEKGKQPANDTLASKVAERAKITKPKKHKIGGYIPEELYQKVLTTHKKQGVSLSTLLEALLTEYVNSVE